MKECAAGIGLGQESRNSGDLVRNSQMAATRSRTTQNIFLKDSFYFNPFIYAQNTIEKTQYDLIFDSEILLRIFCASIKSFPSGKRDATAKKYSILARECTKVKYQNTKRFKKKQESRRETSLRMFSPSKNQRNSYLPPLCSRTVQAAASAEVQHLCSALALLPSPTDAASASASRQRHCQCLQQDHH